MVDSPVRVEIDAVKQAEERMMRYLRYTPVMTTWLRRDDGTRVKVSLKFENLQVTEDFAVRGVLAVAGKTLADARRSAIQHARRSGVTFINPSANRGRRPRGGE